MVFCDAVVLLLVTLLVVVVLELEDTDAVLRLQPTSPKIAQVLAVKIIYLKLLLDLLSVLNVFIIILDSLFVFDVFIVIPSFSLRSPSSVPRS